VAERETEDPLAALKSKDIHQRAAAARDLSRFGEPEVIEQLVKLARQDKSPAVRLCTAGAAADILSRYRAGPQASELDQDRRSELFAMFQGIDPIINAGLFSMLACIDVPQARKRIGAGLRDPRGGIRVGAAVGLKRLCGSVAYMGDKQLEADVVALLSDPRLPPDALAEVARVCASVGYDTARGRMEVLDLPGAHGDLVEASLAVMAGHRAPMTGAWVSDGLDLGEVNPDPVSPPALLVVGEDGKAVMQEGAGEWRTLDALGAVRRMFARRVGKPKPERVLQRASRVWYRATDEDVIAAVDRIRDGSHIVWDAAGGPGVERAAVLIVPGLPESAVAKGAAASLLAAAGRFDDARAFLEAAVDIKKCPARVFLWLGDGRAAAGNLGGAKVAWEKAVKSAKSKKDPVGILARARLAGS